MIVNPKKCYYIGLGKDSNNDKFVFDKLGFEKSNEEVILVITVDNKLTFDSYI